MADDAPGPATRPSLLLRLRDPRDGASWRLFRDVYLPLVYRHCRRRGLQPADAEDVTQQVFAEVFRAIGAFDYRPQRGTFRGWLGAVTRRRLQRFWAGRPGRGGAAPEGALEALEAAGHEAEWAEECERHVMREALARARPHFEAATWRAFEATFLEGRPAAEAAQELGRGLQWVYVAKSRALQRLRQEVRELADDTGLFSG